MHSVHYHSPGIQQTNRCSAVGARVSVSSPGNGQSKHSLKISFDGRNHLPNPAFNVSIDKVLSTASTSFSLPRFRPGLRVECHNEHCVSLPSSLKESGCRLSDAQPPRGFPPAARLSTLNTLDDLASLDLLSSSSHFFSIHQTDCGILIVINDSRETNYRQSTRHRTSPSSLHFT